LAVGGAFLIETSLGWSAWLAAAAHEIPQELGDFAVLVHGGWSPRRALVYNFFSALTFLAGGIVVYASSSFINTGFLLPFAAGNFIYIAAADLIPEIKNHPTLRLSLLHIASFIAGMGILLLIRIAFD
jgi:zinc and cadmium transporter